MLAATNSFIRVPVDGSLLWVAFELMLDTLVAEFFPAAVFQAPKLLLQGEPGCRVAWLAEPMILAVAGALDALDEFDSRLWVGLGAAQRGICEALPVWVGMEARILIGVLEPGLLTA